MKDSNISSLEAYKKAYIDVSIQYEKTNILIRAAILIPILIYVIAAMFLSSEKTLAIIFLVIAIIVFPLVFFTFPKSIQKKN